MNAHEDHLEQETIGQAQGTSSGPSDQQPNPCHPERESLAQYNLERVEVLRQEFSDYMEKAFSDLGYQAGDLEEALAEDMVLLDTLKIVDRELAT